jgi:hypothetical protein
MRNSLLFIFAMLVSCSLFAQDFGIFNENFKITGLSLIKDCVGDEDCLILKAEGRFNHNAYPKIKVELDGKNITPGQDGAFYGVDWMDGSRILVDLDELPEKYDLKITVSSSFNEEAPIQVFEYQKKGPSSDAKGPTSIESLELKKVGEKNVLEFSFGGMDADDFWSYPTYKVEIDGKVVGEQGLHTYGLMPGMKGMVPVKLKALPKHFKAKIYLGSHGSERSKVIEYEQ